MEALHHQLYRERGLQLPLLLASQHALGWMFSVQSSLEVGGQGEKAHKDIEPRCTWHPDIKCSRLVEGGRQGGSLSCCVCVWLLTQAASSFLWLPAHAHNNTQDTQTPQHPTNRDGSLTGAQSVVDRITVMGTIHVH